MDTRPDSDLLASLQDQAIKALANWNLEDQVPVLLKYRENAVFRVRLGGGKLAALRLHRPGYHGQSALASELAWMSMLKKGGISVPEPIPTLAGDDLVQVASLDGLSSQFADLVTWIDGSPLGSSGLALPMTVDAQEAIFFALGQTIAKMHSVTDQWTLPDTFDRPRWDFAGLAGDVPLWGQFWQGPGISDENSRMLTTIRDSVRSGLQSPLVQSLDFGLIHADLVRENIMVDGGHIALIDFDDCGFGWRMFELATALLKNRREPHFDLIRTALVEGYRSRRSLTDAELQTLPLFLLVRSLTYIGWSSARLGEPGMQARLERSILEAKELHAGLKAL